MKSQRGHLALRLYWLKQEAILILNSFYILRPEFETVVIDGEEYVLVKQVKYHKMSTLAIEGIKLLYEEIKALKAEISELRNLKDVD